MPLCPLPEHLFLREFDRVVIRSGVHSWRIISGMLFDYAILVSCMLVKRFTQGNHALQMRSTKFYVLLDAKHLSGIQDGSNQHANRALR